MSGAGDKTGSAERAARSPLVYDHPMRRAARNAGAKETDTPLRNHGEKDIVAMLQQVPLVTLLGLTTLLALVDTAARRAVSQVVPGTESEFTVQLQTAQSGYDRKTCWVHTRAGIIPHSNQSFSAVLTMHELRISGSDVYYPIHELRSDDGGKTWSKPISQAAFSRRDRPGGVEEGICDFWPTWHAQTRTLLGTGHTVRYIDDNLEPHPRPRNTAYSVYDPVKRSWATLRTLDTPSDDLFFMEGAGSTQRVDLENGDILLPTYAQLPGTAKGRFTAQEVSFVIRCSFDGKTLKYLEHGDTFTLKTGRGFSEPSLVRHGRRYLMTLRNDDHNYVTAGPDGLHFDVPRRITFDDGQELGSYNTQTHWLTLGNRLYLVYTRRGANNDHVFRHRAPLFMARFDPGRLQVIRNTERILVPERGARLGNFGVTRINDHESWVTVAEWMQSIGQHAFDPTKCEAHGSNNSIFIAKVRSRRKADPQRPPPIHILPYPQLKSALDADPLPMDRTWQRLQQDGIADAAQYVQQDQQSEANRGRLDRYRQETLVIQWEGAPQARWALNVEGRLRSLSGSKPYFPPDGWPRHRWERSGDRSCVLVYESDTPRATLRGAFQAQQEHVDYRLTLQCDEDQPPPPHLTTHLCFNHCWADGFGRDARVRIGENIRPLGPLPNPKRIWIRVATVAENPLYARLKRAQFVSDGIGGNLNEIRLTGPAAAQIKVPILGVEGRFIASERPKGPPATVAINSPQAIAVGWSFWPCTDIDLAFGSLQPGQPKTISGRIYFLQGTVTDSLSKIQIPD